MAKAKIEAINKDAKKVTIKGKEYQIGKAKWNSENLANKLDVGVEIEFDIKGANFDFKRVVSSEENSFSKGNNNNNRFNNNNKFGGNKFGGNTYNQSIGNIKFDYPYNFVRIEEKVEREAINKGEFSGKIICTLTNKSPIFFPEPKGNEVTTNHSREMFYKKDGKYVIPASSLKGSFRSVLEAISNSCLLNIESERLEKRLSAGAFNDRVFGIIKRLPTENEDGLIVEATVLKVKTEALPFEYKDRRGKGKESIYDLPLSNLIKNYEHIDRSNDFEKVTNGKKDMDGILWISSDIFSKKHEKILYPTQNGKSFKFTLDEYKDIQYLLKQRNERDLKKGGKEFYIESIKSGDPIIFQVDNNGNAKNLAFSEIPRLRYKYSPYDLVPKELKACDTFEDACYACRIFGMTGNNNEDKKEEDKDKISLQGRVFFKDATIDKDKANIQSKPILIKSLGEPHPTLTGFYLENGTYDDKTKIRGRKFYWHHKDKLNTDYSKFKTSITPEKEEKHNSSIQFMNCGNEFNFEVSFKNLKEDELGLLLLTLELENDMLHKFGKAKALGFGSSEVKVTNLLLQSKNRYESFDSSYVESEEKQKFIDNFKNKFNLENKDQWKDLKVILNQTNKLDFSKSPFPESEDKKGQLNTLNWFTKMKKDFKNNFKLPKIQDYK